MSASPFAAILVARAGSIRISDVQATQFERYYGLLRQWNRRINLTALPLEDPPADATLDRLFIEPLVASVLIDNEGLDWTDIGSGGGSPAIPLKIVRDRLKLTMVESRERKAAFLREATRQLGLENVTVLNERFEEVASARTSVADLVSVRGVRIDGEVLRAVIRLLKSGGRLLTFGPPEEMDGFHLVERAPLPGASFASVFRH